MSKKPDDSDERIFNGLMNGLFANGETPPKLASETNYHEGDSLDAFERMKSALVRSGHRLEDCRPAQHLLETRSAFYVILDDGAYTDALVGEIAIIGAEAFERGKHLAIHAPDIPEALLWQLRNLRQASYFQLKGLSVEFATTDMQVTRSIERAERAERRPENVVDDARYWALAVRSIAWIVIGVWLYSSIRHTPYGLWSFVAIIPIWFKAFYGASVPMAPRWHTSAPFRRMAQANDAVAFIAAVSLLIAVPAYPPLIPVIAVIALLTDALCFVSTPLCAALVRGTSWLPAVVR